MTRHVLQQKYPQTESDYIVINVCHMTYAIPYANNNNGNLRSCYRRYKQIASSCNGRYFVDEHH